MRIKVIIPFKDEFDTCKPGIKELFSCKEHDFVIDPIPGLYIGKGRNKGVNPVGEKCPRQLPGEFDYYLFLDSDIGFSLSQVLKLISHDKDIVCGPYKSHANPDVYQCGYFIKGNPGSFDSKVKVGAYKGLVKMDWCGSGFLLVKATVFTKMSYPWFRQPIVEIKRDGITYAEEVGEDVGFCMYAAENGIETWVDFDLRLYHKKKSMEISPEVLNLNCSKPDPKKIMRDHYDKANWHLLEAEKEKAKTIAIAESLGWSAEQLNSFIGSPLIPIQKN